MNPMNIHGVMTDYLHKIRSKVCHAHRINLLKESAENCYVDGVTIIGVPIIGVPIIGVPFCDLKRIEIRHKTQPVSQLRDRCLLITKLLVFTPTRKTT